MKKILPIVIVIAIIAVIIAVMAGNNNDSSTTNSTNPPFSNTNTSSNNSSTTPSPTTNEQSSTTSEVSIANMNFSPTSITVKKGTKVTWTNNDSVAHDVTSDSGSELKSELLEKGESYSHTFNTAGTFAYHCSIHPNMQAKVVVTE